MIKVQYVYFRLKIICGIVMFLMLIYIYGLILLTIFKISTNFDGLIFISCFYTDAKKIKLKKDSKVDK